MSELLTPAILDACPRVSGLTRISFSFDSVDRFLIDK
jgi:hypothetical protein